MTQTSDGYTGTKVAKFGGPQFLRFVLQAALVALFVLPLPRQKGVGSLRRQPVDTVDKPKVDGFKH